MEVWGMTDVGNVREQNQDYYLTLPLPNALAAVLCDGMGGAKSGNIASKLAAEVFLEEIRRSYRETLEPKMVNFMLETAVGLANTAVYENSLLSDDMNGMGTTLVGVLLHGQQRNLVLDEGSYAMPDSAVEQLAPEDQIPGDLDWEYPEGWVDYSDLPDKELLGDESVQGLSNWRYILVNDYGKHKATC